MLRDRDRAAVPATGPRRPRCGRRAARGARDVRGARGSSAEPGSTGARPRGRRRGPPLRSSDAARDWHAYTVEVNPLFVTADGAVAIDAKARARRLQPQAAFPTEPAAGAGRVPARARGPRAFRSGSPRLVPLRPARRRGRQQRERPLVGSHSVGGGESLVVFDALDAVGLRPANYCDTSGAPSQEKVAFAARADRVAAAHRRATSSRPASPTSRCRSPRTGSSPGSKRPAGAARPSCASPATRRPQAREIVAGVGDVSATCRRRSSVARSTNGRPRGSLAERLADASG